MTEPNAKIILAGHKRITTTRVKCLVPNWNCVKHHAEYLKIFARLLLLVKELLWDVVFLLANHTTIGIVYLLKVSEKSTKERIFSHFWEKFTRRLADKHEETSMLAKT